MLSTRLALFFGLVHLIEARSGGSSVPGPKIVKNRWAPEELAGSPCVNVADGEAHRVRDLPGLPEDFNLEQFAGEVCVDEANGGRIFYWMLLHEGGFAADVPLIFWLNGGPGCSSLDGLFMENGPFQITHDLDIEIRPDTWTSLAHMVYVDQPVGTGLSWVDDPAGRCRNQADVNRGFFNFLQAFYAMHPELRSAPMYMSGESYAGHYIPSILAHMALPEQQAVLPIQAKGALIGNGWTEPKVQFGHYADFALGVGIIGQKQAEVMRETYAQCLASYKDTGGPTSEDFGDYDSCEALLDYVLDQSGTEDTSQVNMYDIRSYFPDAGDALWPAHNDRTGEYLKRPGVLEAIHAAGVPYPWSECSDAVSDDLGNEDAIGVRFHLPDLLALGTRLLFYNGQFDLICNHLGTQEFLRTMDWPYKTEWNAAERTFWVVDGKPVGYGQTSSNLTFVTVNGASHMVPMDQPAAAKEMLRRFINGLAFNDAGAGPEALVSVAAARQHARAPIIEESGAVVAALAAAVVAGTAGLLVGLGLGRARSQKQDGYAQLA